MLPDGYLIRDLEAGDAAAFAAAHLRNRAYLEPSGPPRAESYYTVSGQQELVNESLAARAAGTGVAWVITYADDIVGRVALSNVVRGVLQCGNLGYWIDHAHTGRGVASAAARWACAASVELGLHRLEAGTLLDNEASQGVLRRCGFTEIGVAPSYLFVGGAWRDHRLFQRVLDSRPPAS